MVSWVTFTAELFYIYIHIISIRNAHQTPLCINIIKVIVKFTRDSLMVCNPSFIELKGDSVWGEPHPFPLQLPSHVRT